jgi:hypothetical protein
MALTKPAPPPPVRDDKLSSLTTSGYAAMDDDMLHGLIEIRGDDWTGREAAIAALEGAG